MHSLSLNQLLYKIANGKGKTKLASLTPSTFITELWCTLTYSELYSMALLTKYLDYMKQSHTYCTKSVEKKIDLRAVAQCMYHTITELNTINTEIKYIDYVIPFKNIKLHH